MLAYQNPEHPSYHGPKTIKCYGCAVKCSKSAWGPWCFKCNVERMDRIGAALDGLEQRMKFSAAVEEAVKLNDRVVENLMLERNAILRAAGGKVTATKAQHRHSSHWSHQSHEDGSQTYQIDP